MELKQQQKTLRQRLTRAKLILGVVAAGFAVIGAAAAAFFQVIRLVFLLLGLPH
ncbi:hypothetical protein ACP26L_36205 (plasmid) [Paenibacillus sp. S-38]|uniref:hypothetical protein n=1 Tax=Paenibacillus sp. S-38 TaxID=3416710 RepID=UPI003CE8D8BC